DRAAQDPPQRPQLRAEIPQPPQRRAEIPQQAQPFPQWQDYSQYLDRPPQPFVSRPQTDRPPQPFLDRPPAWQDHPQQANETNFPPRRGQTLTGSQFFSQVLHTSPDGDPRVQGLTGSAREQAILHQIEMGNVPDFMRHARKITVHDRHGN